MGEGVAHVFPGGRCEGHVASESCPCAPDLEPVDTPEGVLLWVVVHGRRDGLVTATGRLEGLRRFFRPNGR